MRLSRIIFYLLVLCGIYLMLRLSLPYLAIRPNIDFLKTKNSLYGIGHWRWSFYIHVFTSIFLLVAGLIQFLPVIIKRSAALHRLSGYVYCGGVLLVCGPSGLVMAFYANGGTPARISFVLLALLWMLSTGLALVFALRKKWLLHGQWMARSFALTLSALTLRLYALLIGLLNVEIRPAQAYILISWLSWTVNLALAEVWIRRGGLQRFMAYFRE